MLDNRNTKDEVKKTGKAKKTKKPKIPVVTAYLMNGDKMEFFKRRVSLNEIRVAATKKLDPKRFIPEIIVLRNGERPNAGYAEGVFQIVALHVERDIDFWSNTLKAHGEAKDIDGLKRALVEMSQDARNDLLLQAITGRSSPLSKARAIDLLARNGLDKHAPGEVGAGDSTTALGQGRAIATRQLVANEESKSAAHQDGRLITASASSCWRARLADLFLQHGADANMRDRGGYLCLGLASHKGYFEVVRALLEHGADINAIDSEGMTSILWASDHGHTTTAQLLLKHGANANDEDSETGQSCLQYASMGGRFDVAQLLVKHGADVNVRDPEGDSCLLNACWKGHTNVAELLLKNGADVKAIGSRGMTSILWASACGHAKTAQLLLKHRANANEVDSETGESCLHYASRSGHFDVAQLLVKHGADVNWKSEDGDTCLMSASERGDLDIVELFLKNGANPCEEDIKGRRADWWAMKKGHTDVVDMLLEAIASRFSRDSDAPRRKSGNKSVIRKKKVARDARLRPK